MTALERAVEALVEGDALNRRGAKAELARLLQVEPEAVYRAITAVRRRAWVTTFEPSEALSGEAKKAMRE